MIRSDRALPRTVPGRCSAFCRYLSISSPIVAVSFRSLRVSAPLPASFQNEFDNLCGDSLRGRDLLCPCASEDDPRHAVHRTAVELNVPIIPAFGWLLEIELPRCAPSGYE